jgi:hypothetical protein
MPRTTASIVPFSSASCPAPPAARRTLEEFKGEAQHSIEEFKNTEVAVGPEGNEPVSAPVPDGEKDAPRELKEVREPSFAEETPPAKQQKVEARAQKEPEQRHADPMGSASVG